MGSCRTRDGPATHSARRAMQAFPFFEKPMRLQYAVGKSDAVAKLDGSYKPRDKAAAQEHNKEEREKLKVWDAGRCRARQVLLWMGSCGNTTLGGPLCRIGSRSSWRSTSGSWTSRRRSSGRRRLASKSSGGRRWRRTSPTRRSSSRTCPTRRRAACSRCFSSSSRASWRSA